MGGGAQQLMITGDKYGFVCVYLLFQGLIEPLNRNLRMLFAAAAAAAILMGGSKENAD